MSMALLGSSGRVALEAPVYTLGSAPDNHLVFHDPKVSPRHAALQLQGQQYSITDLGSMDGTYLNEQRLGSNMPVFLKNGDRIRIGDTLYTFEATPSAAAAYPPTVAASSSPSYPPTVQAPQAPAIPGYGQSNPAYGQAQQPPATPGYGQSNPAYGQAQQPPMYGQSNPALPPYGQVAQPTPAYGQMPQPPVPPAYEQAQSAPATPLYGQSSNPSLPPYGQSSNPGFPPYGQSNVSSPGYPAYTPSMSDPNAPTAAYTPAPGQPYAPLAPGLLPYPQPTQPQKKGGMKILIIALIAVLVLGLGGFGIFYVVNLPKPTISISSQYQDGSTAAGASVSSSATTFTVSGTKFSHSSTITFLLDGKAMPGNSTAQSDSDGNLAKTTLTVTTDWTTGRHTITAKDAANYVTQTGVPISIVMAGQDKTPGPNGAPTDSATGTIAATIQGSSEATNLKVSNGTVCQDKDNGQPSSNSQTDPNDPATTITETRTTSCSGSYKAGKLTYTETVTNDKLVFTGGATNGVTCNAQTPYVLEHLEGTFTSATDINGSASSDQINLTCQIGSNSQTINVPPQQSSWSGTTSMQ